MSYLNHATHEINLKIACFVPAETLRAWRRFYSSLPAYVRGEVQDTRLATGTVIAYDFAPELGKIRGYGIRLHVFAGAVTGEEDLRLLGKGADAAVVVGGDADALVTAGHVGAQVPVHSGASGSTVAPLLKEATRSALAALKASASEEEPAHRGDGPAADEPGRWLDVGPYRFLIPDFFPDARSIDEPPLHRLDGVYANQVSLTLAVVLDHGTREEIRRVVASASSAWGGRLGPASLTIQGIDFEGVHGTDCDGFDPPARGAESYAGVCGDDLIIFTILYGGDGASDLSLRRLFVQMIGSAIVRRMNDVPEQFR